MIVLRSQVSKTTVIARRPRADVAISRGAVTNAAMPENGSVHSFFCRSYRSIVPGDCHVALRGNAPRNDMVDGSWLHKKSPVCTGEWDLVIWEDMVLFYWFFREDSRC